MERNLEKYVSYYLFPVMISRDSGVLWGFLFMIVFYVTFAFSISLCGRLNNGPQRYLGPNPWNL